MISFQNPFAFLAFLLLPLLYLLRKTGIFKRISFPVVLFDWGGKGFEWKHKSQRILSVTAKIFYLLAFSSITIALASPLIIKKEKNYTATETQVVFVLDTSPSMAAKDLDGLTRLEASKNAIKSIMESQGGYGFGLVTLGSQAALTIPPTINHQHFKEKLEKVVVGAMGDGSAIGDGLSTAVYHLVSSSAEKKCIILLTDGENNAGKIHPETAAQLAADYQITLYVVGIGTKGTIPIEYTDPKTGITKAGYLESNYNSAALKKIATSGGGKYFEVRTLDELKQSLETVAAQQMTSQSFTFKNAETPLYQHFTLAALLLFAAAAFIRLVLLRALLALKMKLKYKKRLLARYAFLAAGMCSALLAYSGLTWGSFLAPVQKNTTAVSMVFDISYSMLAKDGPEGMTRLNTAALYAKQLLGKMDKSSVSVIIAKGDGTEIIPMTQDKAAVISLLEVLSPSLMTVPGSSIGKGILKARASIPENFSSAGRIWVFTDGEETDGALSAALSECIKNGIPVSIIGFGQEEESAVLSGDGLTTVKTALRSEAIQTAIKTAEEKYKIFKQRASVQYLPYSEKGSAVKLLNQLNSQGTEASFTSYEVRPIPRYKLFLFLTLLFTVCSFIFSELQISAISVRKAGLTFCIFTTLFTLFGCSNEESFRILRGTYAYQQKDYRKATAAFKEAVENLKDDDNKSFLDYALYDLGSTYATMEESEAALRYFAAISDDAPQKVRFAALYNTGVLAHKTGDYEKARESFRKALEIDSHNLDAKINLELSIQITEDSARQNQSNSVQGNQDNSDKNDLEKSIFEHIKENDKKQWKNSEQTSSQNPADDY